MLSGAVADENQDIWGACLEPRLGGTHQAPHLAGTPYGRGAGAGQVEGGQRLMGGREKWRGRGTSFPKSKEG